MRHILFILLTLISTSSVFASDALPDMQIQKIADDVYLHRSFKDYEKFGIVDSNGLVVVIKNDAYIIDTPWSAEDTEKLLGWIKAHNYTIKASISTHFHEDRTAGIELLNAKSIPTFSSKLTDDLLKGSGKVRANNVFDNNKLWLVKDQIEIFYPGAGHSPDNLVVWLPNQGLLFGGCLIRAQKTTTLGNTDDAVINEWPISVEKVISEFKNARIVVPGHGEVGDVSLLEHTRKLAIEGLAH